MEKVTGIKSVDFKIIAKGHGVVNWNGPTNLAQENGNTVDNHTLPKLRDILTYLERSKIRVISTVKSLQILTSKKLPYIFPRTVSGIICSVNRPLMCTTRKNLI